MINLLADWVYYDSTVYRDFKRLPFLYLESCSILLLMPSARQGAEPLATFGKLPLDSLLFLVITNWEGLE